MTTLYTLCINFITGKTIPLISSSTPTFSVLSSQYEAPTLNLRALPLMTVSYSAH
ncbi:MAG: hypothetical protein NTU70_09435 [Methylococcales bacterium]|nr:hypothetical protein [Methylococcales bacterium]